MTDALARETVRVASRGSALALAQTEAVLQRLRVLYPGVVWQVQRVHTEGDQRQTESLRQLGGRGVFVKAIEEALLRGEADLAVHSLKDVPTTLPEGLLIAATPEREDPRDVFISCSGVNLTALPAGGRVGTSAPRRLAQLCVLRPDLDAVELRGNVDSRLRKLRQGECDALILAAAGLNRLHLLDASAHVLPVAQMMPAVGQGALALECRADDEWLQRLASPLDHAPTRAATSAERAFLHALGGGCQWPVAAYADLVAAERLRLRARVARSDGELWHGEVVGHMSEAVALGARLAAQTLAEVRSLSVVE